MKSKNAEYSCCGGDRGCDLPAFSRWLMARTKEPLESAGKAVTDKAEGRGSFQRLCCENASAVYSPRSADPLALGGLPREAHTRPVQVAALRSRDHLTLCQMVLPVRAFLPRPGGDDERTWTRKFIIRRSFDGCSDTRQSSINGRAHT